MNTTTYSSLTPRVARQERTAPDQNPRHKHMTQQQKHHRQLMREQAQLWRAARDAGAYRTAVLHKRLAVLHRWQSEEAKCA